jgi:hypothetical protein
MDKVGGRRGVGTEGNGLVMRRSTGRVQPSFTPNLRRRRKVRNKSAGGSARLGDARMSGQAAAVTYIRSDPAHLCSVASTLRFAPRLVARRFAEVPAVLRRPLS